MRINLFSLTENSQIYFECFAKLTKRTTKVPYLWNLLSRNKVSKSYFQRWPTLFSLHLNKLTIRTSKVLFYVESPFSLLLS